MPKSPGAKSGRSKAPRDGYKVAGVVSADAVIAALQDEGELVRPARPVKTRERGLRNLGGLKKFKFNASTPKGVAADVVDGRADGETSDDASMTKFIGEMEERLVAMRAAHEAKIARLRAELEQSRALFLLRKEMAREERDLKRLRREHEKAQTRAEMRARRALDIRARMLSRLAAATVDDDAKAEALEATVAEAIRQLYGPERYAELEHHAETEVETAVLAPIKPNAAPWFPDEKWDPNKETAGAFFNRTFGMVPRDQRPNTEELGQWDGALKKRLAKTASDHSRLGKKGVGEAGAATSIYDLFRPGEFRSPRLLNLPAPKG